jgi:hypothetical protein
MQPTIQRIMPFAKKEERLRQVQAAKKGADYVKSP